MQERQNSIFVEEIQILPSMQNKGIGSKILHDLIDRAKIENKEIHLEVLKINREALKFYKNNNFYQTGENETHFQLSHTPVLKSTTPDSK